MEESEYNEIIKEIPELSALTLKLVWAAWCEFSDDMYVAGYMNITNDTLSEFKKWALK